MSKGIEKQLSFLETEQEGGFKKKEQGSQNSYPSYFDMRNSFGYCINIDCRGSFQLTLHVTIIILHKQEFAINEQQLSARIRY